MTDRPCGSKDPDGPWRCMQAAGHGGKCGTDFPGRRRKTWERPASWRTIAVELGERMRHHAYCGDHSLTEEDPDGCPFCHDRAAFRRYEEKKRSEGNG